MDTARRMHRLAPMAKKSGRGGRGKQQVVDITPIILTEIRELHRELSRRMDGFEQKLDGFEQKLDGLEQKLDGFQEETRQEFAKVRQEMQQGFAKFRGELKTEAFKH